MNKDHEPDRNEDPITGEPGSHPLGVGVGTAGGAATGAAIGAIGGPVGAVIGAVAGGVAGAYAGKGVAEAIDPTEESAYWRDNHGSQEWASDRPYDEYEPAYRMGYEQAAARNARWEDEESELEREWETARGGSGLNWPEARPAARASWERVETRRPSNEGGQDR